VAELPHDQVSAEDVAPRWSVQNGGSEGADGVRMPTEMAAAVDAGDEEETDTFGWRSIYFDGDDTERVENEDDDDDEESDIRQSHFSGGVNSGEKNSGGETVESHNSSERDDADDESPVFELQDTVIAGRWRQRKRQGRQEIYFDGTA